MPDEPQDDQEFSFPEQLSELAQGAVMLHELYITLREGGFKEKQALYIVAMVALGHPREEFE